MAVEDIEMENVESSNLEQIGYDDETETLAIVFHSGSLYHFHGVPRSTFEGLRAAPSVGKFFNAEVRGFYDYNRQD